MKFKSIPIIGIILTVLCSCSNFNDDPTVDLLPENPIKTVIEVTTIENSATEMFETLEKRLTGKDNTRRALETLKEGTWEIISKNKDEENNDSVTQLNGKTISFQSKDRGCFTSTSGTNDEVSAFFFAPEKGKSGHKDILGNLKRGFIHKNLGRRNGCTMKFKASQKNFTFNIQKMFIDDNEVYAKLVNRYGSEVIYLKSTDSGCTTAFKENKGLSKVKKVLYYAGTVTEVAVLVGGAITGVVLSAGAASPAAGAGIVHFCETLPSGIIICS